MRRCCRHSCTYLLRVCVCVCVSCICVCISELQPARKNVKLSKPKSKQKTMKSEIRTALIQLVLPLPPLSVTRIVIHMHAPRTPSSSWKIVVSVSYISLSGLWFESFKVLSRLMSSFNLFTNNKPRASANRYVYHTHTHMHTRVVVKFQCIVAKFQQWFIFTYF